MDYFHGKEKIIQKKKNNSNKKRKNSQLDQAKALSLESNSWDSPWLELSILLQSFCDGEIVIVKLKIHGQE